MAPRNTRTGPDNGVASPARSFTQVLDNFYGTTRDRRSEASFQSAVNTFGGILGDKANQIKQDERQDELQQGVMDAMREEAGEELQGVRTGKLFRQHSRYYMMGLNETRGKAAATRWKNDLALAYENWDGRHSDDDGTAFRQWMNDNIATFMSELGEDQHRVAGALPIINEVANNFAAQHTGFTAQRLEQESFDAYAEVISGVFDDLHGGKYDTEEGRNWEAVIADLKAEADDMYDSDGARANDHLVTAAIQYANTNNDPDAILALARAHDSGEIQISLANRERLADAMDAVEADVERQTARQNAQETAAAKARRQATLDAWATQLNDDPYADLPDFSEVGDHQTFKEMRTLQDAFIAASQVENPVIGQTQRMQLEVELHNAETPREKQAVLTQFILENPTALGTSDVSKYMGNILAESDPGSLINDQTIGRYRSGFVSGLTQLELGSGFDLNTSSFLSTQGEIHYNDYLLSNAGRVDTSDPAALRNLTKEAEAYAMEQLAFDFPDLLREKAADSPMAGVLGANDALATRDAVVQDQAVNEFSQMAGIEAPAAPETPQAAPETPTVTPDAEPAGRRGDRRPEAPAPEAEPVVDPTADDQGNPVEPEADTPIEDQETPFEDPSNEQAYAPVRQGFYGELIHRFTDGQVQRPSYRDAGQVLRGDEEFSTALNRLADKYDVDAMAIMAVMDFETGGTFSTDIRNAAGSGATGLIQFMPATARALGTTTDELARMSRAEQMVYVEKYFDQFSGAIRGGDINDIYMAVLYPKAIGKADGYVLFRSGTIAYRQNRGLDTNGDGTVTKFEAAAKVRDRFYRRGRSK